MKRISYSQMSTFDECPRKWYCQWIQKKRQPFKAVMQFGSDVHKLLELNVGDVNAEGYNKATLVKWLEMDFSYMGTELSAYEANIHWRIVALNLVRKARLLLRAYGVEPAPFTDGMCGPERRVYVGQEIMGIVDLVARDTDNALWVVDYKTTSETYDEHDIRTSEQLTGYAWLVWKKYHIISDYVAYLTMNRNTGDVSLFRTHRPKERLDAYGRKVKNVSDLINRQVQWQNPEACYGKYGLCHLYKECWTDPAETSIHINSWAPPVIPQKGK